MTMSTRRSSAAAGSNGSSVERYPSQWNPAGGSGLGGELRLCTPGFLRKAQAAVTRSGKWSAPSVPLGTRISDEQLSAFQRRVVIAVFAVVALGSSGRLSSSVGVQGWTSLWS